MAAIAGCFQSPKGVSATCIACTGSYSQPYEPLESLVPRPTLVPSLSLARHGRARSVQCECVNPLPAKLIIYMLPFPVVEGVLPLMESHLTLCSLHKGQTSQDNFAGAAAALEALTDICESPQLVSGKTRGGKWANFLPFLPLTGRENNSP